jgi:EAL domain-containing protein (putative c-di-GMP-specific phosphodiesterase class I)
VVVALVAGAVVCVVAGVALGPVTVGAGDVVRVVFGTGYSGLTWLQTLPVTELKLDRSFIARMLTDPTTHHIVESTIQLATRLGLRVVTEGVEDDATVQALTGMGADLLQGYRYSPPLMADAFTIWRQTVTPS